jgi:hypothetical protein
MLSSSVCWAVFGEVLAREYSSLLYMKNHRMTVDAYAVQHPGEPNPRAMRSVCLHLCALHLVLDLQAVQSYATQLLGRLASSDPGYDWLEPPASLGEVTVLEVHRTTELETHLAAVERWARSAWQAWEVHHPTVRAWVEQCS